MGDKPKFPVGVDVFVVREGKLLLGKRNHGFGKGRWCLPGGHMEIRESIEKAALRELAEETGLIAEKVKFLLIFNNNNRDQHYVHFGVEAIGAKGEPKLMEPDKFDAWEWFDLLDLPSAKVYEPHVRQIQAFKDGTAFIGES